MSAPIPASRAGDASTHEHGDGAKDPQPVLLRLLKPEDVEDADTRMLCKDLEPIKRLGDEPFNAVTVFGKAREGKSTLLNLLAGCRDVFSVGHSTSTCTHGVDAVVTCMKKPDVTCTSSGAGARAVEASTFPVAWLDAEGSGHKGDDYDVKLVLPLLLLSKVALFNTKIAPAAFDILPEAGKLVALMDRLVSSVETKPGGVVGARAESESDCRKSARFGHLFLVFRDFELEVDDMGIEERKMEVVTPTNIRKLGNMVRDYTLCLGDVPVELVQKHWQRMRPKEHGFKLNKTNMSTLEDLRNKLRSKFASIQVWLLPSKMARPDDFRGSVGVMLHAISECLSTEPMTFAGRRPGTVLTGNLAAALLPAACEVMNSGDKTFNIDSMFVMMQSAECERLVDESRKALASTLKQLEEGVKAGRVPLETALANAKQAALVQGTVQLQSKLEALMLLEGHAARFLTKATEEATILLNNFKVELELWLFTAAQRAAAAACAAIDKALESAYKAMLAKMNLTGSVHTDKSSEDALVRQYRIITSSVLKQSLAGACADDAGVARSLDLVAALTHFQDAAFVTTHCKPPSGATASVVREGTIRNGHDVVAHVHAHMTREAAKLEASLQSRIAHANQCFAKAQLQQKVEAEQRAAETVRRELQLAAEKTEKESKKREAAEEALRAERASSSHGMLFAAMSGLMAARDSGCSSSSSSHSTYAVNLRGSGASRASAPPSAGAGGFSFGGHAFTGRLCRDGTPDMRYAAAKDFSSRSGYSKK